MRYNSIKEFVQEVDLCPFCQEKLHLEISGKNVTDTDPASKYVHLLTPNPLASAKLPTRIALKIYQSTNDYSTLHNDKMNYVSHCNDQEIGYYVRFMESDNMAFSVDIESNQMESDNMAFSVDIESNQIIHGEMPRVQKLIWEQELFFSKGCVSQQCQENGFMFSYHSSVLTLERLHNRVCPFFLTAEMIGVTIKGSKFGLITPQELPGTYLLDHNDTIATLPRISLRFMNNKEAILKKIKTFVVFS